MSPTADGSQVREFDGRVGEVAKAAAAAGIPIRIGVNAGSLDKRFLEKYGKATPEALVESALWEASLFEEHGFGDIKISVKHNPVLDRYNYGGGGKKRQPLVKTRDISVNMTAEFDATALADAVLAETPMNFVATFQGAALATGVETLQFVIPCLYPEGEIPKSNGDDLILQNMTFTGLSNLASTEPMWVVVRTSDTAL